jgi:hypothetical protein
MSANLLLLFLSARGQGSWPQFRNAVEELHMVEEQNASDETAEDDDDSDSMPLYQLLRLNLQRIGHVEFFGGASEWDWKVSPPALADSAHTAGRLGVFAGARSTTFMERVRAACADLDLETLLLPDCPDQLRVVGRDQRSLELVAERAGTLFQPNAPLAILASLPRIDDRAVLHETGLPLGKDWLIDRFSPSTLGWRSATRSEVTQSEYSVFRFSLRYRKYVFLWARGRAFQVPAQVGKFAALQRIRRRVFKYDEESETLSVPAPCRPPFLIERALILCSGQLPLYDKSSGQLHYFAVKRAVANLALGILRQETA